MIQATALRVQKPAFQPPFVVCNQEHRFLVAEQMREIGVVPGRIILEPVGRSTAAAATVAALMLLEADPQGVLLLLPADHAISDEVAFLEAVTTAQEAVDDGKLVTFGIVPRTPEPGFGYIRRGAPLYDSAQTFHVDKFVEKPTREKAATYIESGDYLWNSGIFAFRADAILAEMERLQPVLLGHCRDAVAQSRSDENFAYLAAEPFAASAAVSIDYGVMEKTRIAALVPVTMGWSDMGSWEALWDMAEKDESGNVVLGDVLSENTRNSYLRSEGPLVAAVGVEDLIVVATTDAVLVTTKNGAQNVKKIVDQLERAGRDQHIAHRRVPRPWGSFEILDRGQDFQVKRITVNPGARLSLQMHHKRTEHWVVVSGTAKVTCDETVLTLNRNESIYIPLGAKHRLENIGDTPLHLIEVQSGAYLGEDDIVRFEDSYGR